MNILVVDDEPGVRSLIRIILADNGNTVFEAENATVALELARNHDCDVVVTDVVMPGMSGVDLVARLKEIGYPAGYLLVSGYVPEWPQGEMVPFLRKPFTATELVKAVLSVKPAQQPWQRVEAEAAHQSGPCDSCQIK